MPRINILLNVSEQERKGTYIPKKSFGHPSAHPGEYFYFISKLKYCVLRETDLMKMTYC